MKKERNQKRCSKKIVCVLLTASMLFTNAGMGVFAQEEMRTEGLEERLEVQKTEENLEAENTKEETATETFTAEEPEETEVFSKGISVEKEEIDDKETTIVQTSVESVDEEKSTEEDLEDEESDTETTQVLEDNADASDKSGTSGDITWSIDENGKLTVEGTGDFPGGTDYDKVPWYGLRREIKTAEIKMSGMTDASYMFFGCENLTSVDLSGFDAENVTNMEYMFHNCSSLTGLDLSSFHAENVTDMSRMFAGCSNLTSLDLSGFHAENVTNMGGMFSGCSSLTSLDLSSFDVGNVTYWYSFSLYDCSALETINTPRNVPSSVRLPITERDSQGNICTYAWYDPDGKMYSSIPGGLSESILLEKKKFEDIIWNIDENGKLTVEGTGDFPEGTGEDRIPWNEYRASIKTAEIKVQGMTDASYMFSNCWNLKEVDFSDFDTRNVTNMSYMFSGCGLVNVDFSGLDTSKVTNMSNMFSSCNLVNVDFSGLDTSKVTDMSDMFSSCENLTNVDFSVLNTRNVTNMSNMFSYCGNLISLDLSGFNTENVTDMSNMFACCNHLTNLNIKSFETGNVTNMSSMFIECMSLTNLDLSGFNTENVTDMSDMFGYCAGLTDIDVSGFNTRNVTSMRAMFNGCMSLTNLDLSNFNMENVTEIDYFFDECYMLVQISTPCNLSLPVELPSGKWYDSEEKEYTELPTERSDSILLTAGSADIIESGTYENITWSIDTRGKLLVEGTGDFAPSSTGDSDIDTERAPWHEYSIITAEINVEGMTDASYMFYGCSSLISLDVSGFNTESVTDMSGMFLACGSLMKLDLSGLKTENVTSMKEMFRDCYNLTSLDISGINIENVTDMSSMFRDCYNLTSLDVSGFNTENVTDMSSMFSGCSNLTSLDVSGFNTENVTSMYSMFRQCSSLTSLDVSGFNTENVTDMSSMFSYCSNLTSLDVSGFDTRSVTSMNSMFSYCSNSTSLDVSGFNTENVTDMSSMFSYCSNLTSLDVSGFNTENVTSMDWMFRHCSSLTSLDLSSFDASNVTTMSVMFFECDSLTRIYTPLNVPESILESGRYASLPSGTWYDLEGKEYTTLPIGKSNTILLTKDEPPVVTAYITATKTKKSYMVGDTINIDDLRVTHYGSDGTVNPLQSSEYSTNVSELDTSNPGEITLTITYQGLTTSVKLTVSKKEEGGGTEESGSSGESSSTEISDTEGSKTEESSGTENSDTEGSKTEESSSTENSDTEGSKTEESSDIEGSGDCGKGDSPYEDSERTDLNSVNGTIANIKAKVYDKNEYEPVVKVTVTVNVNGKGKKTTLTEGADYSVCYKNNVNAGIGKVIVQGNGIYKGKLEKEFIINKKPIKKLKIVAGSLAGTITGDDLSNLPIYVYDGTTLLQLGTDYTLSDYNSIKATAATVTVKAADDSNYTGSTTVKLNVYEAGAKIINPDNVTLDKESVPYTGKAIKDVIPTVKVGETTLTTKNYKVQYQNNKDAGTAFVIVTGKGEYKGKVVKPFTISAAVSNPMSIKQIPDKTYNGKLQKPTVTVSVSSDGKTKKLSKNKDYKVVYKDNFHAGSAKVIVTGKGNYAGLSAEKEFIIKPQAIKKASVKGTQGNLTLTYSKRVLKEGTDYKTPVYDTPNKNKVSVKIEGMGDFEGEVTKNVKTN